MCVAAPEAGGTTAQFRIWFSHEDITNTSEAAHKLPALSASSHICSASSMEMHSYKQNTPINEGANPSANSFHKLFCYDSSNTEDGYGSLLQPFIDHLFDIIILKKCFYLVTLRWSSQLFHPGKSKPCKTNEGGKAKQVETELCSPCPLREPLTHTCTLAPPRYFALVLISESGDALMCGVPLQTLIPASLHTTLQTYSPGKIIHCLNSTNTPLQTCSVLKFSIPRYLRSVAHWLKKKILSHTFWPFLFY